MFAFCNVNVFVCIIIIMKVTAAENIEIRQEVEYTNVSKCHKWKHFYQTSSENGTQICLPCSPCSAGYGVKESCSRDQDTRCKPCPEGTYSQHNEKHCKKCRTKCPKGHELLHGCTKENNTLCRRCENGTFSKKGLKCVDCSWCPPGKFVKQICSSRVNTVCSPCPRGTYLKHRNNQTFCRSCRYCGYGVRTLQYCTQWSDSVCGDCLPGYFRHPISLECIKCAECYDEDEIIAGECRGFSPMCNDTYTVSENTSRAAIIDNMVGTTNEEVLNVYIAIIVIMVIMVIIGFIFVIFCAKVNVYYNRQESLKSDIGTPDQQYPISTVENPNMILTKDKKKNNRPAITYSCSFMDTETKRIRENITTCTYNTY